MHIMLGIMRTMEQGNQKLKKPLALMDMFLGCIITILKRIRKLMASIIVWLLGFLFIGLGIWIIMLRSEEFLDKHWPGLRRLAAGSTQWFQGGYRRFRVGGRAVPVVWWLGGSG